MNNPWEKMLAKKLQQFVARISQAVVIDILNKLYESKNKHMHSIYNKIEQPKRRPELLWRDNFSFYDKVLKIFGYENVLIILHPLPTLEQWLKMTALAAARLPSTVTCISVHRRMQCVSLTKKAKNNQQTDINENLLPIFQRLLRCLIGRALHLQRLGFVVGIVYTLNSMIT